MKITLNFPEGPEQDIVQLGARLEIGLEKVICSALAVGCEVIGHSPSLQNKIKEHWASGKSPVRNRKS